MNISRVLRFALLSAVVMTMLLAFSSASPAQARVDPSGDVSSSLEGGADLDAQLAPYVLDHFWCYRTQGQPVGVPVGLQDQFDTQGPKTVTVGPPTRLCNPVRKKHGDRTSRINRPDDHLLMYLIGAAAGDPTRTVQVSNQFGVRKLRVYEPAEVLAVPTQKLPHPAFKDTDHFKCYRVKGAAINVEVGLKDQFQRGGGVVGRPFGLCNPVKKTHNTVVTEIKHPKAHLVCYRVTVVQFTKAVTTINQFRQENLGVYNPDLLCVPSKKTLVD